MRIIKENTVEFPTFYNTLITKEERKKGGERRQPNFKKEVKLIDRHEQLFESIYVFGRKIRETNSIDIITEYLKTSLKKTFEIGDLVLFGTKKNETHPVPLNKGARKSTLWLVRTISEDGILHSILDEGHLSIIPAKQFDTIQNSFDYYIICPVKDADRSSQYFIIINTSQKHFEGGSFNRKALQSFIQLYMPRVEYLLQKDDLSQTYDELQLYQSKLSNDFKLSAIGEMTYSLLDQIVSPMQVIMSCVDIIDKDDGIDDELLDTMKLQIRKIESIAKKIVKFSEDNNKSSLLIPCSINQYISKFDDFLKSSFEKKNYELILDLEKNLPPVLSNPNDINQILTNIFSLMINSSETGGLYFQTKYLNNTIVLRVISTDHCNLTAEETKDHSKNINLMMLNSLLKKHEGEMKFTTSEENGSHLELQFPLRRKVIK